MNRLLLLKAHIGDHDRHLKSGAVVHVTAHEDARPAASTVLSPAWIDGQHTREVKEFVRPVPPHNPFAGGRRKLVRIHYYPRTGGAQLTHPSGYITRHATLDAALDHAENTIYAAPKPPEK